jgi:hypothetical protein
MMNLHFDVRDLFQVIRLGWSGKKIWTGLCGLLLAYVSYSVLVTVGYVMSGMSTSEVWHDYGLFPGAAPERVGGIGAILHLLAMVFSGVVFSLTTSMMCKITYQQLRGDDFYSSGEALAFVKKHWGGVIFGPFACAALFLLFVAFGVIIGWVAGLIPVVGELAFAVGFIPIFFASLVAVFLVFTIVAALVMSPAIVGTVGEDALEVVIQAFSLCWSQPWRIGLYLLWVLISVWIGTVMLSGLMTLALGLINWSAGMFMGDKLPAMLQIAKGHLPPVDFSSAILNAFPEMTTVWTNLPEASATGSVVWAGRILGLMLIILSGVIFSYAQAAIASGTSLIYVILRLKKDDENMLEWEDPDSDDFDFEAESKSAKQSVSIEPGSSDQVATDDSLTSDPA